MSSAVEPKSGIQPIERQNGDTHSAGGRYPYLDGLRAVAILTVVIGHSDIGKLFPHRFAPLFEVLGNGQLGVRIFFVISGFLITTLLLKEREKKGTINLPAFYKRRVARIFPAFYALILVVVAFMLAGRVPPAWKSVVAAATFTWNYGHLWGATTASIVAGWLGHFWSLSLEEQFYFFWPVTLRKIGPERALKFILWLVALMPVVRLGSYFLTPAWRGQLGMMFHTAADTILAGAALALLRHLGVPPTLKKIWQWRGTGAMCVLVMALAILPVDHFQRLRWLAVLVLPSVECLGAAILIGWLFDQPGNWMGRILELKPLVWIGLVSYSLYLWQQLFTHAGPLRLDAPWSIPASFAAAIASYYLLEQPSRKAIRRVWRV